jgi:N-acetylglucosamine-6-phosphate deacetylase
MPKTVKPKLISRTSSAVDLHFHGAFGVDFMNTDLDSLKNLSQRLHDNGVSAICATTLSAPEKDLKSAVATLGRWTESRKYQPGCKVLGLHLEGPFLNPEFAGAHPKGAIRPFTFLELEDLWDTSQGTLKILTLAPETLLDTDLRKLGQWAKKRRVRLSLGHSKATESEAASAFSAGFSGITHLWNALHYHHREAGAAGAAFLNEQVLVELIPDFQHLAPTFLEQSMDLFKDRVCLVSDAAPSAGMPEGEPCSFGHLTCMFSRGASRLHSNDPTQITPLAGGGKLLPEMVKHWIENRPNRITSHSTQPSRPAPIARMADRKKFLAVLGKAMSATPLKALSLTPSAQKAASNTSKIHWYQHRDGSLSYKVVTQKSGKRKSS